MVDKRLSLKEAIAAYVRDDLSVAIEGFTAFICFAAGHEIIRQQRRNLTFIRMTPDVIYDQMVAAGVARKLVFSYLGNPGVGPLHCLRRAIEQGIPTPVEIEEYSHYGMVGRYLAGASHLPFFPYAATSARICRVSMSRSRWCRVRMAMMSSLSSPRSIRMWQSFTPSAPIGRATPTSGVS